MKKLILFSLCFWLIVPIAWAAGGCQTGFSSGTCNVTSDGSTPSCEAVDVQAAVNAVATNDKVVVPAGSCNWGSTTVRISSKDITLQGAGDGADGDGTTTEGDGTGGTVITSSGPNAMAVELGNWVAGTGMNASRVTGFKFVNGYVQVNGNGWRIDHMTIKATAACSGVVCRGVIVQTYLTDSAYGSTGLVDHVTFVGTQPGAFGIAYDLAREASLFVGTVGLGDANALYVEDSALMPGNKPNAFECNYGGRYVLRHSQIVDGEPAAHGNQGSHRGCRRWEIYDNTFTSTGTYWTIAEMRGGTGIIADNTIVGTYTAKWGMDNPRSLTSRNPGYCTDATCSLTPYYSGTKEAYCDATEPGGTSPYDGGGSGGYPCIDQIGRATDSQLRTTLNYGTVTQALEPVYIWGNTVNTVSFLNPMNPNPIQVGRDVINDGTPAPGYTKYAYPHPLQGGTPSAISVGSGATIKVGTGAAVKIQ